VNRLTLVHLTFLSVGKPPAAVEFSSGLTVIYGASDTGKSYIEESVDYMLGASELKSIPEDEGYSSILLGLRVDDGRTLTLCRALGSDIIEVFSGDLRDFPTQPVEATLKYKHHPKSKSNISRYLLTVMGIDGRRILQNSRGDVVPLNFRDLARLAIVNDTRMADKRSPVLGSWMPQNETKEKSVFKLLLSGQEEPVRPTAPSNLQKQVGKGKIDLIDQLLDETRERLSIEANQTQLRDQLARLQATLNDATAAAGQVAAERSAVVRRRRELEAADADTQQRASEVQQLLSRFDLLRQQYESDLARLQMVGEAGTILGYFQTGTCVFCGAEPQHQHPGHRLGESTQLAAAVAAETRKTTELHHDLISMIEDLENQAASLHEEHARHTEQLESNDQELQTLDQRLEPLNTDTAELLETRSRLERELALHAQIDQLEDLKASLSAAPPAPPAAKADGIPAADIADFEQVMSQTLEAWQVPGDNRVTYDPATAELAVDGRPRKSRGRGMRSVIHAAFAVSLARRNQARGFIHPGFVVLDSPVLTYRRPEDNKEGDELLAYDVVKNFYSDLVDNPAGQVIVIENGTPPKSVRDQAAVYAFSVDGSTRQGFFPPRDSS
jgi:predicted nuclease with TOPRIM domain